MPAAPRTQLRRCFVLTVRSTAASTRLSLVTAQKLGGMGGAMQPAARPSHAPLPDADAVLTVFCRRQALALGAREVTQPWSTCRPPGFAVGAGAVPVPEPGPEGVVVVVVVVGETVVVVLSGAVVVVVVPSGLTRLLPPNVVEVVVLAGTVVVVVGATVVVVVFGVVGDPGPGVEDGADPSGGAAGVGVVITAVVQAPAFCSVSTSATRRTSEWLTLALSDVNVVSSSCSVFWMLLRCPSATFTAAVAACVCARRSEATTVA